jgi:hypothetical protein
MNKLLLAFLVLSAGAIGFGTLHRSAERTEIANASNSAAWRAATNNVAELNRDAVSLREQASDKTDRLKQASSGAIISPALRKLLAGETEGGNSAAWAELREQLGIGWNSSGDYVLVRKSVLKQFNLHPLDKADATRAVLAITPAEQTAIKAVVQTSKEAAWARLQRTELQRTEPAGDIVAQYTIPAADPSFEQAISNRFSVEITGILGAERAGVFLHQGWNELRGQLALTAAEPITMKIRRSVTDGEPKFSYQLTQGGSSKSEDMRYAHYPSLWFLALFPGGWEAIAQREGFELPKNFRDSGPDK